jgi:hypothetical protein
MFIDIYKRVCIEIDYLYKFNIMYVIYFFIYLVITFLDFVKYEVYVFSRFYRNLRINFCFFNNIVQLRHIFIGKRRKLSYLLNLYLYDLIGVNFFIFFENLIFEVFRNFFNYNLSLYLIISKKMNNFKLIWNDIYSNIIESNKLIINKDIFLYKLIIPKLIYYIYMFFLWLWLGFSFLSYLGLKFYYYKRLFKFKFFVRIL